MQAASEFKGACHRGTPCAVRLVVLAAGGVACCTHSTAQHGTARDEID